MLLRRSVGWGVLGRPEALGRGWLGGGAGPQTPDSRRGRGQGEPWGSGLPGRQEQSKIGISEADPVPFFRAGADGNRLAGAGSSAAARASLGIKMMGLFPLANSRVQENAPKVKSTPSDLQVKHGGFWLCALLD